MVGTMADYWTEVRVAMRVEDMASLIVLITAASTAAYMAVN